MTDCNAIHSFTLKNITLHNTKYAKIKVLQYPAQMAKSYIMYNVTTGIKNGSTVYKWLTPLSTTVYGKI